MNQGAVAYREWDYDEMVVTEYARSGACKACGECCRVTIHFGFVKPPRARSPWNGGPCAGERGVWQEIDKGRWSYFFSVDPVDLAELKPCSRLQDNGLCKVHGDADRSGICQDWPFAPSNTAAFPECGWTFEAVSQREIVEDDLRYAREEGAMTSST